MKMINRVVPKQRDFKSCDNFPGIKLDQILENKIHDMLSFEISVDKVMSCTAEKIHIN